MEKTLRQSEVNHDSINNVVTSVVQTSLRGVDSHGINLFPHYCRAVNAGRINKNPSMTFSQSADAAAVLDADHAFGHHAGAVAMDMAIDLAKKSGIGAVTVKNSTHFGAAAYFALRAAERDCLGFAFTNADALVKAFGAKTAFFGTNPICFTAPMAREEPFCLDMATSLVSWNKIKNYRRENKIIPSHWAFDGEGNSVTNPHEARFLNPAGEYKGFDLGMMVDILCAVLVGGIISKDLRPMYPPTPLDDTKRCIGHFFMALDISKFIGVDRFKAALQNMSDRIRSLPPLTPDDKMMVAGDPEKSSYKKRVIEGIPIDEIAYSDFLSTSSEFEKAIMQ